MQNNPIWAQNRPKWAKMSKSQNRPKWAKMSKSEWAEKNLNELEWALMSSNVNKIFTSVACQCKTWHMLQFFKWRNKCRKKKKKTILWPIFTRLLGHAIWRPSIYPQVWKSMKDFIKSHNPGKFLENSSFGSLFWFTLSWRY